MHTIFMESVERRRRGCAVHGNLVHKTCKGILVIEVVAAERDGNLNKNVGQQFKEKNSGGTKVFPPFPLLSHTGSIRTSSEFNALAPTNMLSCLHLILQNMQLIDSQ